MRSKPRKCGTVRLRIVGSVTHNIGVIGLVFVCVVSYNETLFSTLHVTKQMRNRKVRQRDYKTDPTQRLQRMLTLDLTSNKYGY